MSLQTARCRIRPATLADLGALESAVSAPAFPPDLPLARMHRAGELAQWLKHCCAREGEPVLWSITPSDSADCIGQITLAPALPGVLWLAYWLAPACQGRGLARECVARLLQQRLADPAFQRVIAAVSADNTRSLALLQALGFTRCDTPATLTLPADHLCFSLACLTR